VIVTSNCERCTVTDPVVGAFSKSTPVLGHPVSMTFAIPARTTASKVPEITIIFWVIKVLTTAVGETTSDFFVKQFVPEIAVIVAGVIFVVALVIQLRSQKYVPAIYWFAVVMVSIFGTMAADVTHIVLGVPYAASTAAFAVALAAVLGWWFIAEKTLSIHTIITRRREVFYWATVLITFALGTAAGDWTATSLGLGYFASGVLFAIVIAIPALGWWRFRFNPVFAFWFAYITTRPLGASFADWVGVSHERGGLNVGTGLVSLVLGAAIVALVAWISRKPSADLEGRAKQIGLPRVRTDE
jgi:uncharacterized membrane-anchored protein